MTEATRARFEKWAKENRMPWNYTIQDGEYRHRRAKVAYSVYQAAEAEAKVVIDRLVGIIEAFVFHLDGQLDHDLQDNINEAKRILSATAEWKKQGESDGQ